MGMPTLGEAHSLIQRIQLLEKFKADLTKQANLHGFQSLGQFAHDLRAKFCDKFNIDDFNSYYLNARQKCKNVTLNTDTIENDSNLLNQNHDALRSVTELLPKLEDGIKTFYSMKAMNYSLITKLKEEILSEAKRMDDLLARTESI